MPPARAASRARTTSKAATRSPRSARPASPDGDAARSRRDAKADPRATAPRVGAAPIHQAVRNAMPASIIDSTIFGAIFTSDEMRRVWSDEHRTQKYLDIERALAVVQARLGLIPQAAADEIGSHC